MSGYSAMEIDIQLMTCNVLTFISNFRVVRYCIMHGELHERPTIVQHQNHTTIVQT